MHNYLPIVFFDVKEPKKVLNGSAEVVAGKQIEDENTGKIIDLLQTVKFDTSKIFAKGDKLLTISVQCTLLTMSHMPALGSDKGFIVATHIIGSQEKIDEIKNFENYDFLIDSIVNNITSIHKESLYNRKFLGTISTAEIDVSGNGIDKKELINVLTHMEPSW